MTSLTWRSEVKYFQNAPVGVIVLDLDWVVVDANHEALRQLHISITELRGTCLGADGNLVASNVAHQRSRALLERLASVLHEGGDTVIEVRVAGRIMALKVRSQLEAGAAYRMVSLTDISVEWEQCKKFELTRTAMEESRAELGAYKAAIEQHAIVGVTDRAGRITYVNQRFCTISQYQRSELIGKRHSIVNSGHHPKGFFAEMWKTIAAGHPWHGEICNKAKDGSLYWVDTTIMALRDARGLIEGYVSVRYDITEKKLSEVFLHDEIKLRRDAETLLRDVIDTVPDAIAAFDSDDKLIVFNSAYRDFFDKSGDQIRPGASFEAILRHGVNNGQYRLTREDAEGKEAWINRRLRDHKSNGRIATLQLADGRWLQSQERRSPTGHTVGVRTDITAIKEQERLIKLQAERDPLTGLFNRSVLQDRLVQQLRKGERTERHGALVLIDLDNFKDINDTLGHGCGDALLVEVGRRITNALRASDIVMRLGGDEFALILPNMRDVEAVDRLMGRLYDILTEPMVLGGRTIQPSASSGICIFPADGYDPAELLKFADIALYQAKARGKGDSCYFNTRLREGLERREAISDALRRALDADELDIALQPQFDTMTGAHTGFEALARWPGSNLSPAQFIPVAEETGLIIPLGLHVLDRSLAEIARLTKLGFSPGAVAVNVAAAQLKLPGFPETIAAALGRHGLQPSALEIEVTENVLLDRSASRIAGALERLHRMGIAIALDDFGTGHASLSHLKRFHVDRLKIDRSFVSGIGSNAGDDAIVRTIIQLAHSLGMTVVAEGIETTAQLHILKSLKCDVGQGYLVSPPLAPADVPNFLSATGATDRLAG